MVTRRPRYRLCACSGESWRAARRARRRSAQTLRAPSTRLVLCSVDGFSTTEGRWQAMATYQQPPMSTNSASDRFAALPHDETLAETDVGLLDPVAVRLAAGIAPFVGERLAV